MRLLIVADRPSEAVEPLSRARHLVSALDGDAEIVLVVSDSDVVRRWAALVAPEARLVPVDPWSSVDERLEAGLLLRGDCRRSVQERLAAVGTDFIEMPLADRPLRELSA